MTIDFGRTATDYAQHRAGFPPQFFQRLMTLNILKPGIKLLDIGTGTGTVALGCAAAGADVIAIDPSPSLLDQARRLAMAENLSIDFREGRAERTGLAPNTQDCVVAGQCWHWFDRPVAAAEIRRILKPGGYLVIAHFDWVPLPGNVASRTEDLILSYNPRWTMAGGTGFYPAWTIDLGIADYGNLESFSFDVPVSYSHEAWRGRIRASAGVAASLDPATVARFDKDLAERLRLEFPQDPLSIPHRVWALVARKPL